MKALSIKQPWAAMIASGQKTIETRTWKTAYRGPLLLVASSTMDRGALAEFFPPWTATEKVPAMPRGVAVCIVNLVDCRWMVRDDEHTAWCFGDESTYAWVLENVRIVEPKPIKGRLGLYEVEWP